MFAQMMGFKPGDWMCPGCGDHQFARNATCRKCGTSKMAQPTFFGGKGSKGKHKKAGDWHCPNCNDLQFAKNVACRRCNTPNPDPEGSRAAMEAGIASGMGGFVEKPGDWMCPACGDLQFAKNLKCRKCGTSNPEPEASLEAARAAGMSSSSVPKEQPGDWYCTQCGDLQFARNMACRRCGAPNVMKMAMMASGKGGGEWRNNGLAERGGIVGIMKAEMESGKMAESEGLISMLMNQIDAGKEGIDGIMDIMSQTANASSSNQPADNGLAESGGMMSTQMSQVEGGKGGKGGMMNIMVSQTAHATPIKHPMFGGLAESGGMMSTQMSPMFGGLAESGGMMNTQMSQMESGKGGKLALMDTVMSQTAYAPSINHPTDNSIKSIKKEPITKSSSNESWQGKGFSNKGNGWINGGGGLKFQSSKKAHMLADLLMALTE